MSDTKDKKSVFVGQLFQGDPKNKSWTPIVGGQVGVSIQQTSDGWTLVAAKKETVWEMAIGSGFKHRVRDNFVQWQRKCVGGTVETFGLRVRGDTEAQQMSEALTKWLSKLDERKKESVVAPPLPSMQHDDVVLKVFIPGRDPTNVCVPQSATVQQVMKSVCQRRELDPAHFLVTLPPNSPGGHPVVCKGHMIIGELSTNEIHLSKRRKSPKRESPTHSENSTKEKMLLQVELPKGEHTVVRVSPTISMTALLSYICEKRNISMEDHHFDLPATMESLANKTLQELKINSIRVISTATESGSDQSANSSPSHAKKVKKRHTLSLSSLGQDSSQSRRRNAPPPPPPPSDQRRRTQPGFMKELAAEMVTRQSHDIKITSTEILTTPTGSTEHVDTLGAEPKKDFISRQPKRRMTTGSRGSLKPRNAPAPPPPPTQATPSTPMQATPPPVAKGRPPPVAEKPHKTKPHLESIDEPDYSGPADEPVLKGVGVKGRVKEQKERPDLTDSITEALKKQTATAERRHTGISRKRMELSETRHLSLDSDTHTPPPLTHTPPLTHPIMVPIEIPDTEDDQLFGDRGKTLPKRRGPAPRPPPSYKTHTLGRTARQGSADTNELSRSRDNLEEIKDEHKEKKRTPRSPRKRPSRPAPVPPPAAKAIVQDVEIQETILDFKDTPSPPPQLSQESPPPQPSHTPSSPPPQSSQESPPPQHKRSPGTTQKATAICQDTEDGGKVLIVQPSPSIDRRAKVQAPIIFKLPPPPPQPNRGGNKEKKSISKELENETIRSKEDVAEHNLKLEEIKEVEKIKVEEIKKVKEVERPNDDTILSNEYTNLDDSDASEEVSIDFTNERIGNEQNGMYIDSTATSSSDSEGGYDVTVDDQSDSPNKKPVLNGAYTPENILNLSINSNGNNSNDSADELGAPPPPPNCNYGDDSADELEAPPPPPNRSYGDDSTDELEAPPPPPNRSYGDDSANELEDPPPPPPVEFEENSSNSSIDSLTELSDLATEPQATPTHGGDILLLSYKPSAQTKESPTLTEAYKGEDNSDTSLDAASVEGVRSVESVGAGWTDEPVSPGLSSQLMELDSVVSDLRDLLNVEDNTTLPDAATVAMVTSTIVPVPPPPHVGTPTQSQELPPPAEDIVHVQPPPPPTEEVVLPPPLEGPSTQSQELPPPLEDPLFPPPTLSQDVPILPPPPSTLSQEPPILPPPTSTLSQDTQSPQNQLKKNPIPTKPKPPVVSSKHFKPSNVTKPSTISPIATTRTQATKSTNELLEKFRERQAKLKAQKLAETSTTLTSSTPAAIPTPNVSVPIIPSSAPLNAGGSTGNDAVQAQLAFLQQQVLQQQMLQLQQQFQQLQSLAMQPGAGMGGMPGAGMGGPYLPPGQHNPMMFPGAQPMMMGQAAFQMPPGYMGQPGMPLYATQQPTGYNTPPHPAMFPSSQLPPASHNTPLLASHPPHDSPPPPLPSQPPPDLPLHTSSPLVLRKVSQDTRAMALGGMEDKFDSLMGEVRESDPATVLKKVPVSSNEGRDSPEPTGMAAALEVALRQRRQHFSDHDKRRSIDDSYSSEWQSP